MNLLDWIYPRRCVGCKSEGKYICDNCRKLIGRVDDSLKYRGVVRKILKEIKYRGTYDMVREVVKLWDPRISDQCAVYGQRMVVTAVPMWEGKKRLRGFNQAELIAREVARRCEVVYVELLRRTRVTTPMYGLKRWEREVNVEGAFEVRDQCMVQSLQDSNTTVILVDDVWTSGATMRECVRTLKLAGFTQVLCMTLAR